MAAISRGQHVTLVEKSTTVGSMAVEDGRCSEQRCLSIRVTMSKRVRIAAGRCTQGCFAKGPVRTHIGQEADGRWRSQ